MVSSRFPTHSVIEKLGDALAVKLMGYFGSTIDSVVKVYLSLDDLSEFYAIREDDILHVEEAPEDELPYGGSAIWVKPDAHVERCVRQRTSTEARFLSGEIAARMAKGPAVTYSSQLRQALEPETAACDQGSVWPCSVVWGYCVASNFPCVNTQQPGCWVIVSAQSCFTCAGDTCVGPCYSVGCPPTHGCTGAHITQCCQIFSAKCPATVLCRK
jgi:hypothetical protein